MELKRLWMHVGCFVVVIVVARSNTQIIVHFTIILIVLLVVTYHYILFHDRELQHRNIGNITT